MLTGGASAQEAQADAGGTLQSPGNQSGTQIGAAAAFSVHGVVKNAATDEPLARVLVRPSSGAPVLTDSEGRFELFVAGPGQQILQLLKPGYHDYPRYQPSPATMPEYTMGSSHAVFVTAQMPDLSLAMTPTNSIRGQIELSTGDTAQGIGVMLLRRGIQDGRAAWMPAGHSKANSDGVYRFSGLDDGSYIVLTDPSLEDDGAAELTGAGATASRNGYASVFYPDARDLSGAAKIQVAGGQQAQANLTLTLEPFQAVRAIVRLPGGGPNALRAGGNLSAAVVDGQGHQLPYTAQYSANTRSVEALLPDGTYSLTLVDMSSAKGSERTPLAGQAEFTVAGHAVTNLEMTLASTQTSPLQTGMVHGDSQTQRSRGNRSSDAVFIAVSQAGGSLTDGMEAQFAEGPVPGTLQPSYMAPGPYWVHTTMAQPGICEDSFTAGGASLAREPLVLGPNGTNAPLTLTLRDDCASLNLSLPAGLTVPTAGEETAYTVYVVPDFDSTAELHSWTLRPSSGGTVTVADLTPGNYHVYAFPAPVVLEYRNPDALAALPNPGQAVTLSPGTTSTLMVEVPAQ